MIVSLISKIAEQIHRQIDGGDIALESKWDIREIQLLVEQFANKLAYNKILSERQLEGEWNISGGLIGTYTTIPIKRDVSREISYSDIPVKYIQLPLNKGIEVMADRNENGKLFGTFVLIQPREEKFLDMNDSLMFQGRIGYRVEGSRVIYFEDIYRTRQIQSVTMKLIVASPDGETLYLSPDLESELIEFVKAQLRDRPMPDMVNDNNPTK